MKGAPEAHRKAHSHPIKVVLGPEVEQGSLSSLKSQKEENWRLFSSERALRVTGYVSSLE